MWVPRDVSMTSSSDMWVQRLCVADMWGQVNGDQSMVNMGRVQTGPRQGWIWAGLGSPRGMLWHCHVTAMGSYWASFLGYGREHGSRWTKWRWSMDLRQGAWWTKSTLPPSGLAFVHRVHACVAGEGIFPCFLAGVFPPAMCSPASFCSGASA